MWLTLRVPLLSALICDRIYTSVLALDPAAYQDDTAYIGATVGRYANRIAGGTFVLDGRRYTVPCNEGEVALHGGPDGFDRQAFTAGDVVDADGVRSMPLRRTSPAGENRRSAARPHRRGRARRRYDRTPAREMRSAWRRKRFPNAPNEPHFPGTVLRPGERYHSWIVVRFGTDADMTVHDPGQVRVADVLRHHTGGHGEQCWHVGRPPVAGGRAARAMRRSY